MDVEKPALVKTAGFFDGADLWMKVVALSVWLLIGAFALLLALSSLSDLPWLQKLLEPLQAHVGSDKALFSPLAYFCLLSLVFALERSIPAREQAILTVGLLHDMVWYVGSIAFRVAYLGLYALLLADFYQQYLSFLTIESISSWSAPSRFLVAVFLDDFLTWLSHLIRHKVPLFWKFHAVHHSQSEMNLFTDARVHPFDRMISATLKFIPFMMLGIEVPIIMIWAIFDTIYPKFYHANVRLNLGPLRYILVTPQSHRVHHGRETRYQDKNFGRTFSVWDRIFGTQYHDDFDYPATGVADPDFPLERAADPQSLAVTFAQQLIYPFQQIFRAR
jgi:sterol desaturase/sphingolipid hydroxylase (fatty acid hydroxylase superfamily)